MKKYAPRRKSPAKQTDTTWADGTKKSARDKFNDKETSIEESKGTEYDIIINKLINQKGNWNDGKKASDYTPEELARIKDPKYQAKLSKAIEAKEARENAAKKSPTKQLTQALLKKRKGLGPREIQGEDDQSYEAHVTRKEMGVYKNPSKYWYKINGQNVSKEAYKKYENKPGGDEPGKQTNDPDAYGRNANNHGRGKKTK
jgi:hypothetical protein